ncbi:hypothetical protein [Dactylosporangium matsuzakiense]|uniref:Uncharacterized protein n=1 Tax=Dactylosporangium matsuzakiense TaxID=53360 RepID=A0A9W6KQB4_9ACTN|nr:hypothetical protein [Dactylosporangium matsuzakiense]UWZ42594.1 hypothetical protein Dmats_34235 [Dactylosporangium matsuzakiense]GLL06152.1 hypothetical protein GCM10017581_079000 [Dactylosporangium matsuzakiense]
MLRDACESASVVVRAAPSRDLSGWVQEFTTYRERLARPLRRQEIAAFAGCPPSRFSPGSISFKTRTPGRS